MPKTALEVSQAMITRRSFLVASGLTALASTRVFGANDRLRIGVVGAGERMKGLLNAADHAAGAYDIVAVADVYAPFRDSIKQRSNGLATTHGEYREVLDQNLDAVIIASPDHWHVQMAVDALKAGKDVYLEKPVTHTIDEGAVLTRAVRSSKQILQCGMQQRSWTHFRNAVDLIQAGLDRGFHDTRAFDETVPGERKSLDERLYHVTVPANGRVVVNATFETRY